MKKNMVRAGVAVFFSASIIISVFALLRQDSESIETVNTAEIPEEYQTDITEMTDALQGSGESETMPPYAHDIDPELASYLSSINAEQTADVSEETAAESEVTSTQAESTLAPKTSRTVITSRQRKEYDSNSVYIDMENILQNPELPVGCEITALTCLLRHYGFNAEKTDMARNYLPVSWGNTRSEDGKTYKDSFYDYFIGDPFSKGYGCFSPAIEKAANSYISSHGGGVTVKNISGCHPDTLYEYLTAGTPVLCWATDGMIEPEYYETWYDNATGEQLDWYLNEHCFVLAGFNISANTVTLNDPMKGIIDYNIDKFEVRFKQMHSQAIVLIPDNAVTSAAEETVTSVSESDFENEETSAVSEVSSLGDDSDMTETSETAAETLSPWATSNPNAENDAAITETEYGDSTDFYTGEFYS